MWFDTIYFILPFFYLIFLTVLKGNVADDSEFFCLSLAYEIVHFEEWYIFDTLA